MRPLKDKNMMKKILTLALLAVTSLAASAQEDKYKAEMDMLDA